MPASHKKWAGWVASRPEADYDTQNPPIFMAEDSLTPSDYVKPRRSADLTTLDGI
jgi:hypothetical protein